MICGWIEKGRIRSNNFPNYFFIKILEPNYVHLKGGSQFKAGNHFVNGRLNNALNGQLNNAREAQSTPPTSSDSEQDNQDEPAIQDALIGLTSSSEDE